MGRTRIAIPLLVALVACASAPARRRSRRENPPALDGRPVYPAALVDPQLVAFWRSAQAQLADHAPEVQATDLTGALATLRPWFERRNQGLLRLEAAARSLQAHGAAAGLFGAVVFGSVADDLGRATAALRLPTSDARSAHEDQLWREMILMHASLDARLAATAWQRCNELVAQVPLVGGAWVVTCAARAHAALEFVDRGGASRAPAAAMPPDCTPDDAFIHVPEAPPPDESVSRETVVLPQPGSLFEGAAGDRLLEAVGLRLARDGARVVPTAEVRAALTLQASRRARADGPVCGQAPPLIAVLAERHRNLVAATVTTYCGAVQELAPSASPRDTCLLEVELRRVGTTGPSALLGTLAVELPSPQGAIERWIAAAPNLVADGRRRLYHPSRGIFAAMSSRVFFVVDQRRYDPWLRVGRTLAVGGDADGSSLDGCVAATGAGRGVGSYRLTWTVSPTGDGSEARAEPVMPPGDGSEARVAACLTERMGRLRWPCPRDGLPARIEARVCLGRL